MGDRTKIDWCDASWNPVTGCLHGCEYCYARGMANRFKMQEAAMNERYTVDKYGFEIIRSPRTGDALCVLHRPYTTVKIDTLVASRPVVEPYPVGFIPSFHEYRLSIPATWRKPRTIFVCSMADLFGEWVPDEWIRAVFNACEIAPQHRYLFLTKNPKRYIELAKQDLLPRKHWYGYSATKQEQLWTFKHADECPCINLFVSIEPILEPIVPGFCTHTPADWVIIGAETGRRTKKVTPEKSWIDIIREECEYSGRPIFMKESLRGIMGADFIQEFPWDGECE